MPGQRAKNKVPFGGFIDRKLHRKIIAVANKAGWRHNRFGFFLQLLTPIVNARYRGLKARQKKAVRRKTSAGRSRGPKYVL